VFFSTRGGKRGLIVFVVAMAALGITACSSDDPSTPDDDTSSPSTRAADADAVEDLVSRYWAAVVKSENTVDANPGQFDDVAEGQVVEEQVKTARDYEKAGIRRVGEPEITEVEASVSGDTADIMACLNEDGWTAEQDGSTIKAPKLGPKPWGAQAKRRPDGWVITDVRVPDGAKEC